VTTPRAPSTTAETCATSAETSRARSETFGMSSKQSSTLTDKCPDLQGVTRDPSTKACNVIGAVDGVIPSVWDPLQTLQA